MFKFIHAADIHLDSPLKGLERYDGAPVDEIRQASRRALENLVDLAIAERVGFVLIAGDLYDGDWQDYNTGLYLASQMARLADASIPVILIAGNHDAANRMTKKLRLPENVHKLSDHEPETFVLEDYYTAVHGQSFATAAVTENLSALYPNARPQYFNVGLLHSSVNGREGHEHYAPCTVEDLRARQYQYWALGHVHQRETLCKDPPIVFSGNIQGRHIRESSSKGCMLVTVDDGGKVQVDFRVLDVVRWHRCRVDASQAETGYQIVDSIGERLRTLKRECEGRLLAVRIEVHGRSPAHAKMLAQPHRWTQEVRSAALESGGDVWIEKVELRTSPPQDPHHAQWSDGPIAELLHLLSDLQSDAQGLRELARELDDLKKKLPPELKEGPNALDFDSPDRVRETLEQIKSMLLDRLLSPEVEP